MKKAELTAHTILGYIEVGTGVDRSLPVPAAILDTKRLWTHSRRSGWGDEAKGTYRLAPRHVKQPNTDYRFSNGYLMVQGIHTKTAEEQLKALEIFLSTIDAEDELTEETVTQLAQDAKDTGALYLTVVNPRKLHGLYTDVLATVEANRAAEAEAIQASQARWETERAEAQAVRDRLRVLMPGTAAITQNADTVVIPTAVVAALLDLAEQRQDTEQASIARDHDVLVAEATNVHTGAIGTTIELVAPDGVRRPQWALSNTQASNLAHRLYAAVNADRCDLCGSNTCDDGKICADDCEQPIHHTGRVYSPDHRAWCDTYVCECSRYDAYDTSPKLPYGGNMPSAPPNPDPVVTRQAEVWSIDANDPDVIVIEFIAETIDTRQLWSLPVADARALYAVLGQALDEQLSEGAGVVVTDR